MGLALARPQGAQWTPEQKEEVYQLYRTDIKNGGAGRSLRKLAELTDINIGTIAMWSRTLGWQKRMMDDDGRDAELRHQTARMKLINELDPLIDNMVDLAYHAEKDKDRIDSSKFLLQLMGYSPIQKIQQDIIDDRTTKQAVVQAREHKDLDLQSLSDIVNRKALAGPDDIVDAEFTETGD